MNDKVVVERNKRDSTQGIIKKMAFQPEKRWEICFKAKTWKKKNGELIFIVSRKGKNKTHTECLRLKE